MAVSYRIDLALGVIFNTYRGVLTDDDLYTHQRQMQADPDFRADLDQLSDYLAVTEIRVSSSTIHDLAQTRTFLPGVRRAIVVDSSLGFGLSRMFQMLHDRSGEQVQVFRELSLARRWLGLDSDAEDPDGQGGDTTPA